MNELTDKTSIIKHKKGNQYSFAITNEIEAVWMGQTP